jgi:hypothetical protein
MKNYFLILLFVFPIRLLAQTDTTSEWLPWEDTTWSYSISECDLVLKLKITSTSYVTDGGQFVGKVLKVEKGFFKEKNVSWSMGMMEISTSRWRGRYQAIYPKDWKTPYIVYAGFMKTTGKNSDLFDQHSKQGYVFFMSVQKFP